MNRIMISVNVVAIGQKIEYQVPPNMAGEEALSLILNTISDSFGVSGNVGTSRLVSVRMHRVLNLKLTISQNGLINSDELLLI